MSEVVRLQIEVESSQLEELEGLAEIGGARTKRELFNNALTLLKWAVAQKQRGLLIVAENPFTGASRELQMPFLENVAASARRGQPDPEKSQIHAVNPK